MAKRVKNPARDASGLVSRIYSLGVVKETAAKEYVASGKFIFVPIVVRERRKGSDEFSLNYGFFILNRAGELYDVYNNTRQTLKTLSAIEKVHAFVSELEPNRPWIALQPLSEESVAVPETIFDVAASMPNYKGWKAKQP